MADTKLKFIPHMKTNSCFCFSSKTGCLIIGYIGAIYSSLCFIITVTLLLSNMELKLVPLIITFIHCIVPFFSHLLLIQGVNEQKPRKMYFWIYLFYIALIIFAIIFLLGIIVLFGLLVLGDYTNKLVQLIIGFGFIFAIILGLGYHIFSSVVTHCQNIILMLSMNKPLLSNQF